MSERRPLSIGFHPAGLFVIPMIALLLSALDVHVLGGSWRAYGVAAMWVVPWHLFQLFLDYRNTDRWYSGMTAPPYRLQPREVLALRWPALVAVVPAPFLGIIPVCSVWLACLVLYYPWQRALYHRSQREFGSLSDARNG